MRGQAHWGNREHNEIVSISQRSTLPPPGARADAEQRALRIREAEPFEHCVRHSDVVRIIAALCLLSALVSGCESEQTHAASGESQRPAAERGSVTVTWKQALGEVMYMEGAVPDFALLNQDGVAQVATRRNDRAWTWESLPPGTYRFRAGLRPCSGSCDYLDPRTDSCSDVLVLDGGTEVHVHVRLTTGRSCSLSTA